MKRDFEPQLHPVLINELRPTQMTVGLREVARKRTEWRKRADEDGADFSGRHTIPTVLGPRGVHYIIDHHHLALALHDEGVTHILVSVVADLHALKKPVFWTFLDNRNWLHPYDGDGQRHDHDSIPKKIGDLTDDPYRSLAGELRRAGGYGKDSTPYSEFLWADFLRRRIAMKLVSKDFERAVLKALNLAHSAEASYLPGWCGPED